AGPHRSLSATTAASAPIFPAVQNLLLAARALGLGTTLTTLHRTFEKALKALLASPAHVEVAALVPPGHPRDRFGPTRRRPLGEGAHLDRCGTPLPTPHSPAGSPRLRQAPALGRLAVRAPQRPARA